MIRWYSAPAAPSTNALYRALSRTQNSPSGANCRQQRSPNSPGPSPGPPKWNAKVPSGSKTRISHRLPVGDDHTSLLVGRDILNGGKQIRVVAVDLTDLKVDCAPRRWGRPAGKTPESSPSEQAVVTRKNAAAAVGRIGIRFTPCPTSPSSFWLHGNPDPVGRAVTPCDVPEPRATLPSGVQDRPPPVGLDRIRHGALTLRLIAVS